MPIKATCPGCQAVVQVADESRGKKVRCGKCQAIFVAGAAAPNSGSSSVKPANGGVKPAGSTPKPAAARPKAVTSAPARPKAALKREDDEDAPPVKKKKKSMLPACLIGCGVLFLLCGGGGGVGGYFAWIKLKEAANEAKDQFNAKTNEIQNEIDKERQRFEEQAKADMEKAKQDQQRIRDEQKKKKGNNPPDNPRLPSIPAPADNPKPPDNPRPPDNPKPPDRPNPPQPGTQGEVVQSPSQSIPLGVPPTEVYDVLWTGGVNHQAVVIHKSGFQKVFLDQFDLATGRKVGSAELASNPLGGVRDISPDGKYYVSQKPGSAYALWALPEPKPLVDNWLPQPPKKVTVDGKENMVIAAYLLGGEKLLTVNGMGQVVLWKIPDAAGQQPQQMSFYDPPASVAKYPAGMGYGLTALSPDRKRLAVYNGKDGYFLLDTDTLKHEGSVTSPQDARPVKDAIFGVLGVSFSPDSKQLATMFHQQQLRRPKGTPPMYPQLIRWDVESKQRLASVQDPTKGGGGAGSRIAWWGNEFCWLSYPNRVGSLHSWEKQSGVLRSMLGQGAKICPGSPDGKCWFVTAGPDRNAVLKGIDLPALALKAATDKPLVLTPDGIVRK